MIQFDQHMLQMGGQKNTNWKICSFILFCSVGSALVQKHHTLVGHLRVPEKVALALESHSGQKGIFITRTGVDKRNEKVKWMPRLQECDADNYLLSCLAEARENRA